MVGRLVTRSRAVTLAVLLVPCIAVGGSSDASARPGAAAGGNVRTLKLDLITRLDAAPETVVLGSSRGMRAEPAYLRALTGRSAFNAAVTSGTAADAWVMTRYLADCRPLRKRRYLWFVDVGVATNGMSAALKADPRSHKYIGLAPETGPGTTDCRRRSHDRDNPFNVDGSFGPRSGVEEHWSGLEARAAELVASIRANPPARHLQLDPRRYVWFERALAFMNRNGSRPVIVFNPVYPTVLAELEKFGYPTRAASRVYLARLHKRFDFVVVDAQDIRRWGGSRLDFRDPTHINTANMRRLLAYVVRHSNGALR